MEVVDLKRQHPCKIFQSCLCLCACACKPILISRGFRAWVSFEFLWQGPASLSHHDREMIGWKCVSKMPGLSLRWHLAGCRIVSPPRHHTNRLYFHFVLLFVHYQQSHFGMSSLSSSSRMSLFDCFWKSWSVCQPASACDWEESLVSVLMVTMSSATRMLWKRRLG